ncbi:kynureninase [Haladaptatus pallidirubidus]|uniref:Kynureninase n=1 Tax=Haladaptatus pallidirubidus TaxID=1008152 RepID=A0AAV3UPV9_9EURY|nr:kynureninase [Haladaptatus pallidirubidus]
MDDDFELGREHAQRRDDAANVTLRDRFYLPDDLYLDGNSLGPLSTDAEDNIHHVLDEWRELGIRGWTEADPAWFHYGERLGERLAPMVGAREDEVVVANSTTINIHTLVGTFLDRCGREGRGQKVVVNDLDFPTDHYAIRSQLRIRGLDPNDYLIVVESQDGRTVREEDIAAALDIYDDVGIVFMPSVLYRSGQLLNIESITDIAHDHDAYAGFDLAHSVGAIPHSLAENEVDFAVWCHYKYLNAGPGAIAGLYVHRDYHGETPALAGWWGHEKETQFEMRTTYTPAHSAGAWQTGTIPVLSAAPLLGVLNIVDDVGIEQLREQSVALTDYLMYLVDERLPECSVGTPRKPDERGGHVAVEHEEAYRLTEALKERGVVGDFRPPNVVRLCPSPLYVGFEDVWNAVEHVRELIDEREYEQFEGRDGGVT